MARDSAVDLLGVGCYHTIHDMTNKSILGADIVASLGRGGPVKREVTHPGTVGSSVSPVSKRPHWHPEDISTPLFVLLWVEVALQPFTPITPAGGNRSKWCFRLPTGLPLIPTARTSGQTPSQAEDIKFKTRPASYNDDELNSPNASPWKMPKEERCRPKDDRGYLVTNHARRGANQDAEVRPPRAWWSVTIAMLADQTPRPRARRFPSAYGCSWPIASL